MAGYKDTEIEAAVSRFVKSNIRIEKDALGPVDMGSKFDEVLQLTSSTLVYDPNAIFYIIYLASNRLNVYVELAIEYIEDVADAIDEMGYRTEDVTRTTLLGDASAALLTVDQILTDNKAISSRAFTRYQQAVDSFTSASLEPNIKQGGQIVRPPQLARKSTPTTINSLSTTYVSILSRLAQIRSVLDEFNGLSLGTLAIQNSVQKVRDDLRALQEDFENTSTTRDDKIALCREAYLSIAAGKSVLNNFVTVIDPSDARLVSSSSVVGRPVVADATDGEFVSASVTGTNSAPWEIITGSADTLLITEDGESERTYTFTPPTQPSITAAYKESYDIVSGTNDLLEIDGLSAGLSAGTRDVSDIVDDINTWSGSGSTHPYLADVLLYEGYEFIRITKTSPGATEIRMTADNGDADIIAATYETTGFYEGMADSSDGLSAAEAAQQINDAGYITASVARTVYYSGDSDGTVASLTGITLPSGTLSDTNHGHVGDMLVIRSGVNAGYHRITSVVLAVDTVNVSSDTPFKVIGTSESWVILSENLKLTSKATDLDTEIFIGSGDANDVMGFVADTVSGTAGTTTGFAAKEDDVDIDFAILDVVAGDVVLVTHDSTVTEHEVLELTSSNLLLELSPPLGTDWTVDSFSVLSAAVTAYEELVSALSDWDDLLATSEFSEDILELERVMNPLIANKNPSISQLRDASGTLQELKDLLTSSSPDGLTEILKAYQVGSVSRIDAALKMLKERGMDRAYDLLMDGKLENFFNMDKDDTSSSAYMLKSMRSVVQSDLRVSKLDEDGDDTTHLDLVVGTDPNYDYSDSDADENIALLGSVPDYDSEYEEAVSSKQRY